MSVVNQESIHSIMHRRLSELDSAIDTARSELKVMEDERDIVAKIIRDYRLLKSGPANSEGTRQPEREDGYASDAPASRRKFGAMTIKEMALAVLTDCPDGLKNGDIFEGIKTRFGVEVQSKSLSPQLGRLANEKKIVKEDGLWKLAQKNAG